MKKTILFIFVFLLLSVNLEAKVISRGYPDRRVALTFDDGPQEGVTEKILDILEREKVPATFFVQGRKVVKNPELIRRMAASGHEIGNHTYHHTRLTDVGNRRMLDEVEKTSQLLFELTGSLEYLFRPPHGKTTREKTKILTDLGYLTVLWSVNADDYYVEGRGIRTPVSIAKRVVGRAHNGAIILMHDNSQQIVTALPLIIEGLRKKGFAFTTVSGIRTVAPARQLAKKNPPLKEKI
jgi:peptidoglycan/xylan/chitin deacetylase (PgdA/CDA1 family)